MRFLLLLSALSLVLAACEAGFDSDDSQAPTPIVITSTPSDGAPGDAPTNEPDATATATEADNGTLTATADDAPPTPTQDGQATATPAEDDDATRALIEEIQRQVVELRGLDILEDINEEIIDRDELAVRIQDIIAEEYSPEEGQTDALTYWLLRLIPDREIDLYQLQIDLYNEQVAGYYDPEAGDLVVVTDDGVLAAFDKVTMAHEIVHALQDQHFDLVAIDEDHGTDADRRAAISALVEGDASLAMTQYMFEYLGPQELIEMLGEALVGGEEYEVLENAPRYIADGLLFSYEAGQEFAMALYEAGGYAAIDAALADPPLSTEQILHPEKFIGPERDDPLDVQNPDISNELGDGWDVVRSDSLGEWDLRIMLEENGVDAPTAATATEGWGGAWLDVYTSDRDALALLTTRWDSEQDATEFGGALLDSFQSDAQFGAVWSEDGRYFSAIAGGDTVVLISGTDQASVNAVLAVMSQTV